MVASVGDKWGRCILQCGWRKAREKCWEKVWRAACEEECMQVPAQAHTTTGVEMTCCWLNSLRMIAGMMVSLWTTERKMGKRSCWSSAGLLLSPQTAKIFRIEVAMEESLQIPWRHCTHVHWFQGRILVPSLWQNGQDYTNTSWKGDYSREVPRRAAEDNQGKRSGYLHERLQCWWSARLCGSKS